MDDTSIRENVTFRIKHLLQSNGVKLWLPPYYQEGSSDLTFNDKIVELAEEYKDVVNADFQLCAEILLELQDKCLQRLQEQNKFKAEGMASITVKVSGQNVPEFTVHLRLSDITELLRQNIAEKVTISAERLKLIANGKILQSDSTLEQQGVKHGNTVLVIVLPSLNASDSASSSSSVDNVDEKILNETMKDLEFLTQKSKGKNVFSVTNQSGHFLNIPESSRQHLLAAMTLHEKGRSAFKRGVYSLALVFYLEADNEFKLSRCDLLDKVDNYGLLNLDIVWCYLHLKSVHYLSDAETRLRICDESFRKCYGPNLERLKAVKGTCGNESVLLVRLHLLQAILHHLMNRNAIAREKFNQVEAELKSLRVNDEKITTLIGQLNCTPKEARLGLRASFNDPDAAFNFILEQREQKKRRAAVERIKSITDGCICADGTPVDPEKVKQLVDMGYSQLLAICGLKNSNNDMDNTIIWISNYIANLKNLYPAYVADVITNIDINSRSYFNIFNLHKYEMTEACIANFIAKSVGLQQATEVFPTVNFKTKKPTETLNSTSSPGTSTSTPAPSSSSRPPILPAIPAIPAIHDPNSLSPEEYDAYERLSKDMSDTTDDYLDSTLESEENFFVMYKSLLK